MNEVRTTGIPMGSVFALLGGLLLLMPPPPAAGGETTCLRDGTVTNVGCVIPDEPSPPPAETIARTAASESRVDVPDRPAKYLTAEEKRAWLKKRQRALDHRALEVQRARFIAKARGESEAEIDRLNDAFGTLQAQRRQNQRELDAASAAN